MAHGSRPNGPKQQKSPQSSANAVGAKPGTPHSARPQNAAKSGNPARRNGTAGVVHGGPAGLGGWISGARLRTLPLAIAPVALGTGAAVVAGDGGEFHWVRALFALLVAVSLQIGVNYANDYSDGIRGTDDHRVGPARLTGGGAAKPRAVLTVALVFFGVAAVAGLALIVVSQHWWLLVVGAAAIVAAWFYTGGKRPYGYLGLGEIFVFVFFGLVATTGTTYVQVDTVNLESWLSAVAIGLMACAVLMVNNLRDIKPDKVAGKRTLAVRIGARASRVVFCVFLLVPFVVAAFFALFYPLAWFTMFVLLLALPASLIVATATTAKELILALKLTSLAALLYGVALGLAFAL
ncbi:MAG: 1,4-dihydroxy-2-naphthoate polyprenyltransferase [Cryobacterium sp.]|nr:1,4-dihydroxy-2-naphthoate polyprenyltransferase [Cryobacterium sp.]